MGRNMRVVILIMTVAVLAGCGTAEQFWDKEVLGAYAPDKLREKKTEQGRSFLIDSLQYWQGKPKSERVRVFGAPDACTPTAAGGEVCEWTKSRSKTPQAIVYAYDREGIARSWGYRGAYGEFTSADYAQAKSGVVAPQQVQQTPRPVWAHPSKPQAEADLDYMECKTDVQKDPQFGFVGTNMSMRLIQAIDQCMGRKGWLKTEKR
jgi:hypothetical protein